MPSTTYLYILAGTAAQAAAFTSEVGMSPTRGRYVSDDYILRGLRDPHYVVVGTFWQRPDANRIWDSLQAAMMTQEPLIPVKWSKEEIERLRVMASQAPASNVKLPPNPINAGIENNLDSEDENEVDYVYDEDGQKTRVNGKVDGKAHKRFKKIHDSR